MKQFCPAAANGQSMNSNQQQETSAESWLSDVFNHSPDMIIVLLKCATFGFFITLIPIRRGLHASQELTSIPIAVLNGMVMVFLAIMVIEVLSSIIRFI